MNDVHNWNVVGPIDVKQKQNEDTVRDQGDLRSCRFHRLI